MKTQLLQDIGDSGAAPVGLDGRGRPWHGRAETRPEPPAGPAAGKRRPAVWHRARAVPDAGARLPEAGDGPAPSADSIHDFATAPEPDWLAELMRQDAARAEAQQKAGRWRRRLLGWSLGAGVLTLGAAGALWTIDARRVDGAMDVVAAAGTPAIEAPAAGGSAIGQPALKPGPAPTLAPLPSLPHPAPAIREDAVKPAEPASTAPAQAISRREPVPKAASKAPVERVQPDRRKREETLLQCRALGYDEGQCIRRECGMTRFGLACRGGVMGADVPP